MSRAPFRHARRCAWVSVLWLFHASPAAAQSQPFRLEYAADAECPDAPAFLREVTARTSLAREAGPGEPARTFGIEMTAGPAAHHGVLRITEVDGAVSRREVDGTDCEEVARALAFMMALAIDPTAMLSRAAAPAPAPPPRPIAAPVAAASEPRRSDWRWGAGLAGRTLTGFVPSWAFGGGLFVDFADLAPTPLAPSVRLSAFAETTHTTFLNGIGLSATWLTARAEVCPARIKEGAVSVTACATLDAGALATNGTALSTAKSGAAVWLAPGALGRLAWDLSGEVWLEGAGGLGVPLERYTFYYHPGGGSQVAVFQVPGVGGELGIGAGYRIP